MCKRENMYTSCIITTFKDSINLNKMEKLSLQDEKSISLEILLDVHNFCIENGISYSLGYGTMLGAVRHKGFIPWDDDIDILMMRDDYERFLSTYKSERYCTVSHKQEKEYILPYAKVVDTRTLQKNVWMPNLKIGLGIDVFPVDYIGESFSEVKKLYDKKRLWGYLFTLKVLDIRWRGIFKTLIMLFSKIALLPFTKSYLCEKLESFANNENVSKSGFWGVVTPQDAYLHGVFKYDIYNDITNIEFEGHQLLCLSNTDEYLSKVYGDYMQLPPLEKRVSTHVSESFALYD